MHIFYALSEGNKFYTYKNVIMKYFGKNLKNESIFIGLRDIRLDPPL